MPTAIFAKCCHKSHNHLEDCLRENGLFVEENKKEWEHYTAYVQAINQILTKKGLRYGKHCTFS